MQSIKLPTAGQKIYTVNRAYWKQDYRNMWLANNLGLLTIPTVKQTVRASCVGSAYQKDGTMGAVNTTDKTESRRVYIDKGSRHATYHTSTNTREQRIQQNIEIESAQFQ